MNDLLSDEEEVNSTHYESSPNLELSNSCIETAYDQPGDLPNPIIQQDHSYINFQRSATIVTQVACTVQYQHHCMTATEEPIVQHPWECPGWQPWKPFSTSQDYDLVYAYWKDEYTKMHINCVLERSLNGDVGTFKSADELCFL